MRFKVVRDDRGGGRQSEKKRDLGERYRKRERKREAEREAKRERGTKIGRGKKVREGGLSKREGKR